MVPAKLLVGGTVAVGSTATAAVVANKYGLFSTSTSLEGNQGTETGSEGGDSDPNTSRDTTSDGASDSPEAIPTPAVEPDTSQTKPNQEAIKKWLASSEVGNSSFTIFIKDSSETSFENTDDGKLADLSKHLETNKDKLLKYKNPSAGQATKLVFKKEDGGWTLLHSKETIENWVSTISSKKVKLVLHEVDQTKNLETLTEEEFKKLFTNLEGDEKPFKENLSSVEEGNPKNVIFIKDGENWKHIKKALEEWLTSKSGNTSSLSLKESNSSKQLSDLKDEDLKKLFKNIKDHEQLFVVWKDEAEENKPSLEFKKEGESWKITPTQKTIEIWVKATSNKKATLKLWENDAEKQLDGNLQSESEAIFKCLEESSNKSLFSSLSNNASSENKTLVFEKDNTEWKHIKKAIKDWLESSDDRKDKLIIQIKKGDNSSPYENIDDDDLTGLLKHLKDHGTGYVSQGSKDSEGKTTVTLKKTSGTWAKEG